MLASFWFHFGSICFPGGVPGTGSRNVHEMLWFWSLPGLPFGRYFQSKNHQTNRLKFCSIFECIFMDFDSQNGSQNPPPNSPKINQQICPKIDAFFHNSLIDFVMIFKIFSSIFRWISLYEVNAATYDPLENFRVDRGSGLSPFINKSFNDQVKNNQKNTIGVFIDFW